MNAAAEVTRLLRDVSPRRPEQDQPDADEIQVSGYKPIVPDGTYEAKFLWHETAIAFGSPKVFLHFEVVEPGEYMGIRLFRAYRVRTLTGKRGKGGRFVAHPQGELFGDLTRLLDIKLRKDRISLAGLRTMLFRVTTRTVARNYRQREMPLATRYSVIQEIARGE